MARKSSGRFWASSHPSSLDHCPYMHPSCAPGMLFLRWAASLPSSPSPCTHYASVILLPQWPGAISSHPPSLNNFWFILLLSHQLRAAHFSFLQFPLFSLTASYARQERVPSWFLAAIQSHPLPFRSSDTSQDQNTLGRIRDDCEQTHLPPFSAPTSSGWELGWETQPIREVVIQPAAILLRVCNARVSMWMGEQIGQKDKQVAVLPEPLRSLVFLGTMRSCSAKRHNDAPRCTGQTGKHML